MVKHSPIDRLRHLQQQRREDVQAEVHPPPGQEALPNADAPPALEHPAHALPPVDEALRMAAQARAEADALEQAAADEALARAAQNTETIEAADDNLDLNDIPGLHPNVNARRRGARGQDRGAFQDFGTTDDLGASFVDGDDFPGSPPPWLSQVIQAAVTAAATAVAALPSRPSPPPSRSPMAPTKLSDTAKCPTSGSLSPRNGSGFGSGFLTPIWLSLIPLKMQALTPCYLF